MSRFAHRTDGVGESATLRLNALAKTLKAQGKEIFNLTAGEPDFRVHPIGEEAVRDALAKGLSKYTPVAGYPELRSRVAARVNGQQGMTQWREGDVVVSNGGKQAIFNTLACLVNPGDEVVIVAPYWLSYPVMVKLVGGESRVIQTDATGGYKISPAQLSAAIGPKTRAVIFNSPSNPTGATYSREEYRALGAVLTSAKSKPWILSDEIYDELVYTDEGFVSFLAACPELASRTVTLGGLSKSAALTGWRLGWSVCETELAQTISNFQSQTTSGINALAQWAGIALLDALADPKTHEAVCHRQIFARRAKLTLEILSKGRKLKPSPPAGAFYAFVDVSAAMRAGEGATRFAERLLADGGVAVVPGEPFGDGHAIRVSFATDEKTIQEGCRRLVEFTESQETGP